MNRGQMRTMVRNRIGDVNSVHHSNEDIDLQLDASAMHIASKINSFETVRHNRDSYALTATTAKLYPLWGFLNFQDLLYIERDDGKIRVRWVHETEFADKKIECPGGYDEEGRFIYTIRHEPNEVWRITPGASSFTITFEGNTTGSIATSAAASTVQTALEGLSTVGEGNVTVTGDDGGPWTATFGNDLKNVGLPAPTFSQSDVVFERYRYLIEFIIAPGNNFTLIIGDWPPSIPTGTTYDNRRYSMIPQQHDEVIVQHAVFVLGGHLQSGTVQFAGSHYQMIYDTMMSRLATKPMATEPRVL